MEYLPFNLEVALKHPDRIITRDGKKITEMHHFQSARQRDSLVVVIDGKLLPYKTNGIYHRENEPDALDLFLLPDYKEMFVNVYRSEIIEGEIYLGNPYDTLKEAKIASEKGGDYIKTIRITSLPYEQQHNNK